MVQLLAKMAPTMATSCYFELDQCEVFLGNDALMNVNWQKKRPFPSQYTPCDQNILSLRDQTIQGCNDRIGCQCD